MTLGTRFRPMAVFARGTALAAAALGVLALGPGIAPAGAAVVKAGGVEAGVQPRSVLLFPGATLKLGIPLYAEEPAYPERFANPTGAPVLASSRVYAIYWDPTDNYHGDWQHVIDNFLQGMGAASGSLATVFAVDSQYTDAADRHSSYRSTFMGAATDTEPYPTATCADPQPLEGVSFPGHQANEIACLTDKQIRGQLEAFVAHHSLPKGMGTVFYVLTPPGVTVCLDEAGGPAGRCSDYEYASPESHEHSFCSYHSFVNPDKAPIGDANTILYAVIPWTAGNSGDRHLFETLMPPAFECQDGGFNPASKPIEQKEKAKEKKIESQKEKEEHPKNPEEEAKAKEEQEKREALEGPHAEEPNQGTCPSPDGTCDMGLADVIVNQIAVEQQNTVTDPLLSAWQDTVGNEATDECRNFFAGGTVGGSVTASEESGAGTLFNQTLGGGSYYLNDAFDLAALKLPYPAVPCLNGINLVPQFTAPNPVNAEETVGFNGMESNISLDAGTAYNAKGEPKPTYPVYTWDFGDGTPTVSGYAPGQAPGNPPSALCEAPWLAPCAASTFHSYQYGGTYEVTLTVSDTGGNTGVASEKITVVGPPRPGGGGPGGGPSTPGGPAGPGGPPIVTPVATAAALSGSLKQVARSGLVVRYSVNEQVAGRFEVLLNAAVAHRLGITGPTASMPAGTSKTLVIGRALLVTTKAGRSTVRIKFSRSIAKHLRRAHKVTLTLRLVVRNASSQSPQFTTVVSTVVLHR